METIPLAPTRRSRTAPETPEKPSEPAPPATTQPTPESAPKAEPEAAMPALDLPPEMMLAEEVSTQHLKILVLGDSGAGKTHFASKGKGVCVLSLESQGRATIKQANPKAYIWPAKTMNDIRKCMEAANNGVLAKHGVTTLVLDSVTELQQVMIEEILGLKREAGKSQPNQPATGKGPAPEMTQQDWGILATKMRAFLRNMRDLPMSVVVTALCEYVNEENSGVRRLYPKLSGSMQMALPSFFNIVGFLYKSSEGRVVMTEGPDQYLTKSYGPLVGLLHADLEVWRDALDGKGSAVMENARMPGQSTTRRAVGV